MGHRLTQRNIAATKEPLSFPPSQRGTQGGMLKKLTQTCPHENGEKKFLHGNTICWRFVV